MNSFKIASQDIKYKELIKECAKTKLPVQIDTGNATLADIETAVEWIKSQNNEKLLLIIAQVVIPLVLKVLT